MRFILNLEKKYQTQNVLLTIGRRGTPRKLDIQGENLEKVAYRLIEPEHIAGKNVLVVGGGDSAIESALLLTEQNNVTLSYRGEFFKRLKPKNLERLNRAVEKNSIDLKLSTNPVEIKEEGP